MDHTVLPATNTMPAFHQMSPPQQLRQQTSSCSSLLIYRPQKDEGLSWPSWLTYNGWLTHISGHPSATSRAQDSESTSAKDQCSTAGPRNQPVQSSTLFLLTYTIFLTLENDSRAYFLIMLIGDYCTVFPGVAYSAAKSYID